MRATLSTWFGQHRLILLLGLAAWVLLSGAGLVHAQLVGLDPLQAITVWNEWFVALLIVPYFFGLAVHGRHPLLRQGYLVVLLVFALDLGLRAAFGLGWEPFLVQ